MSSIDTYTSEQPMTPERNAVEPVCPPAPRRLRLESDGEDSIPLLAEKVEKVEKPVTMADHRGLGILPGDFIKPDTGLTRVEARRHLLVELERWLTGRICDHACQIYKEVHDPVELSGYLADGTWPAARLCTLLHMLEHQSALPLPKDFETRVYFVGAWAASVCSDYLHGFVSSAPVDVVAAGFVTTDRLQGGVIESLWNHSPFEALRNAPPLTDEEETETETEEAEEEAEEAEAEETEEAEEDEEDEEDEEAEEAEEEAEETGAGIDAQFEALTLPLTKILDSDIVMPGWVFVAGSGIALLYVWTVALALSMYKHC